MKAPKAPKLDKDVVLMIGCGIAGVMFSALREVSILLAVGVSVTLVVASFAAAAWVIRRERAAWEERQKQLQRELEAREARLYMTPLEDQ